MYFSLWEKNIYKSIIDRFIRFVNPKREYYNQCKAYLQARLQGSRSRLLRERFAESKASAKHRLDKGGSQRSIIYVLLIFEKSKINPCCLSAPHRKTRFFAHFLKYSRSSLLASRQTRTSYIIIYVTLISQYVKLTVVPCGTTPKTEGFRTLLEI